MTDLLDPPKGFVDNRRRPGLRALSVRDQQPFRFPVDDFFTRSTRLSAANKTSTPFSRCTAVFADQTVQSHQNALPAPHRRFRMPLNEIANDNCAGFNVEECDFLHGKRSTEDHLVNVVSPRGVGQVIELRVKVQIGPSFC